MADSAQSILRDLQALVDGGAEMPCMVPADMPGGKEFVAMLDKLEQATKLPDTFFVNDQDFEALKSSCAIAEGNVYDGIKLIPSKRVPRGMIVPAEPSHSF